MINSDTTLKEEEYELDVQEYIKMERNAADIPMKYNDTFTNSLGITYTVLADSPAGNIYVKTACDFSYGSAIREIPKIVLIS